MKTKKIFLLGLLMLAPVLSGRVKCKSTLDVVHIGDAIKSNDVVHRVDQIYISAEIEYELEAQTPMVVYENEHGSLEAKLLMENDETAEIEYTIFAKKNDGAHEKIANPFLVVSYGQEGMVKLGSSSGNMITLTVTPERI